MKICKAILRNVPTRRKLLLKERKKQKKILEENPLHFSNQVKQMEKEFVKRIFHCKNFRVLVVVNPKCKFKSSCCGLKANNHLMF